MSSVELAMGKLIVFVGEFLVCIQFNAKIKQTKKKKKKKKKTTDPDQTLYSVSSAELAQKLKW